MMIMSYDGVYLFSLGEILYLINDIWWILYIRLDLVQSVIFFFVYILGMVWVWDLVNMECYC